MSSRKSALVGAIISNDIAQVKLLLNGPTTDILGPSDRNATPLHLAAQINRKEVVEILLTKGALINAKNISEETPLHIASLQGHSEIVTILLDNGADKEARDSYGYTPLHYAAQGNHKKVVEILLTKLALINAKINNNKTPLHLASQKGYSEIVSILLHNKADKDAKDKNGNTSLHYAAKYDQIKVVEILLKSGALINVKNNEGNTAFQVASKDGYAKDTIDLSAACASNNYKDVERILQNKADLLLTENTIKDALDTAVKNGSIKSVELFMEHVPEAFSHTAENGHIQLLNAAQEGHTNLVRYLLDHSHSIKNDVLSSINNASTRELISFYQNNLDITKNEFFTSMTLKLLNVANKDDTIPVTITFNKVPQEDGLYSANFSFTYGKEQSKTLILKPRYAEDNPHKIEFFEFYKLSPRGSKQEKSISYVNDIIFIQNKKTGKPARDKNKVLFNNNFPVKYSDDLSSISITMNTDNKSVSRTIILSTKTTSAPNKDTLPKGEDTPPNADNLPKAEDTPPNAENLPKGDTSPKKNAISGFTDTKARPRRSDLIGNYVGNSTYQPVAYAEIKDNRLWLMFSNNEIYDFEITINGNENVISLQGINDFRGWKFTDKFEVYLQGDELVLECAEAKKKQKQSFVFSLTKTEKAKPMVISVEERAPHHQALNPINIPAVKQPKITAEPETPALSKNQIKKQARKRRQQQQAQENLAKQQDLMPDVPDAESARTLPPAKEENEQEFFKNSPSLNPQTMAQDKKASSLGEKDFDELLTNNRPAIKLKPTPHRECPLLQDGIVWEGVGHNIRNEQQDDKKLLFSLKNFQNRKGVWGSLWASALGKEDNYANGKNIHWSYHKQDNGDEYLYISHHYLFKIIKSVQDDGYTLELVKNNNTKRLNDVNIYKVYPKNIEDITKSYVMELFGIIHDEVHEEELIHKYNDIYARILKHIEQEKINLSPDFYLYFISEKTWELLDFENSKKRIIRVINDTITIENKKRLHKII